VRFSSAALRSLNYRLRPIPHDAISDKFRRSKIVKRRSYFFFLRFIFFAFFAVFLFFAIAALLAMMSGDAGSVQSRIELHCNPITPAQQKKHCYRLTERVWRRVARCALPTDANTNQSQRMTRAHRRERPQAKIETPQIHILSVFSHADPRLHAARERRRILSTPGVDNRKRRPPVTNSRAAKNFSTAR
jgi:hypothetical protein